MAKANNMQTTIEHTYVRQNNKAATNLSPWKRFINWADGQEKNRFGWTAGILVGHGCIVTIFTMLTIVFTGNHFIFWPFAMAAMSVCVIVNLAAMPTKITIPVFFISLLVDIAVIATCLVGGLST